MAILKITTQQAQALLAARKLSSSARKAVKKQVFAEIHAQHGIPRSQKIKMWLENPEHPQYLQIRCKRTGKPLDNGVPEPVVATAVVATPKTTPAKAPAKAVAAIKTAAKGKAKPAVKTPAKPVAKAAKKVEKGVFSKTKTDKCQIEVRATLGSKRVRLGYASSQEMKAKVIAKAKAAA